MRSMPARGYSQLWNRAWNSVMTHHDNRVPLHDASRFRYREFVCYEDLLALPLYVVVYTRLQKYDPGSYMRRFDVGTADTDDPLFCPMDPLPAPA